MIVAEFARLCNNVFLIALSFQHPTKTHKAAIADSVSKRMQRMAA